MKNDSLVVETTTSNNVSLPTALWDTTKTPAVGATVVADNTDGSKGTNTYLGANYGIKVSKGNKLTITGNSDNTYTINGSNKNAGTATYTYSSATGSIVKKD